MHILAGEKKGMPLVVPKEGTRPTTNKIKKSLFDSIQHLIDGSKVLDLYAGSGALGLEALSRGAAHATFIEKDQKAADCLKKNIDKLSYQDRSRIIVNFVERSFSHISTFDLIFMDPPYELDVKKITTDCCSHLNESGLLIVEQSKRAKFVDSLPWVKKKEYGDTVIYFFDKTLSKTDS